jgi:hypothetical protein
MSLVVRALPFVLDPLVLAPLLSLTAKPWSTWINAAPSAGEFAKSPTAAAGMQATTRDLTEARLEIEGLYPAFII